METSTLTTQPAALAKASSTRLRIRSTSSSATGYRSFRVAPKELAETRALWMEVAGRFLAETLHRSGSERTKTEYGKYIARFVQGVEDPGRATLQDIQDFAYGAGPSGKAPSPSTINVRLAALRGFYDTARRMHVINRNPVDDVKRAGRRDPSPRGLTAQQVHTLLDVIPATPGGRRDRAIILTGVLTGLRRSELLGLRVRDIELVTERVGDRIQATPYYRVQRMKGGKERYRELPRPAFEAIAAALDALGSPLAQLDPDAPLFAISSPGFYANLKRYAAKAGLQGVTPHVLRHTAAKLRREAGSSLEDVSLFLGHENLQTTSIYLARLEGDDDPGWKSVAALLGVSS